MITLQQLKLTDVAYAYADDICLLAALNICRLREREEQRERRTEREKNRERERGFLRSRMATQSTSTSSCCRASKYHLCIMAANYGA